MNKKKIFTSMMLAAVLLTGCSQSTRVSYNVSKEANNFNVVRRITVINARTDTIIYEMEGVFSISNSASNELTIVCQIAANEYKKHFIYLNANTLYVIEDISGADVSPYHYEVTFYPQMVPVVDYDVTWEG